MVSDSEKSTPQIKICGITQVDHALQCAELGADAIGCVFFPKSPRHVSDDKAREISDALPNHVTSVGVFVGKTYKEIMEKVEKCNLRAVQLHGKESPELVQRLRAENLIVIKALFIDGTPALEDVKSYEASGFIVECSGGPLPGGNALTWNWDKAKAFGERHPLILAGGLSPENVKQAIQDSMPDAVDVSSGVELSPGIKDLDKIKTFIAAVRQAKTSRLLSEIY
ncbi:MAG: phosphoribosylanthranilate isomerase [Deltaproteobacteria bacterium]|nr:phosphoribosylanthranilate isomerase [Deltaproteobacteria bacterium]